MNGPKGPAAPTSGCSEPEIPTFEELAADPEIAALLDFDPVPRKNRQANAWTPELQREFIARLAVHGAIGRACTEVGRDRGGAQNLYNSAAGASFRAAWHAAIDLAKRRLAEQAPDGPPPKEKPPSIDYRWKHPVGQDGPSPQPSPARGEGEMPGQVLNEFGEWEDEDSLQRRAEDARDSISNKLLKCRRLYLREISASPGKRAAFEILTGLPVDWERAERLEPQPDEPWRRPNMREPDMLLTAENGWLGGMAHGRDKMAELRAAIDEHRAEKGLPPVDWSGEE